MTEHCTRTFKPANHISWHDVAGELALFDTSDGTYHALNGSAAAIWRGLARGKTAEQIVRDLAATYDIAADVVAADVDAFLRDALARRLIARE
jgi:PqqD family protein of HPr-rel-A system